VCLDDLFGTYDSSLFQRFMDLGVDLTADHELAAAFAYHTSNKPLFALARRHREATPKIQEELNIALGHHAGDGNEPRTSSAPSSRPVRGRWSNSRTSPGNGASRGAP
jgi:hypothetical protein